MASEEDDMDMAMQDIKAVVDEYLGQHQPASDALDEPSLRFCALRLLLLQAKPRAPLSPKDCSNFVACLYVLFVEEALIYESDTILGFAPATIFNTMTKLCESVRLMPEEVVKSVQMVDKVGNGLFMARQPEFVRELFPHLADEGGEDEASDDCTRSLLGGPHGVPSPLLRSRLGRKLKRRLTVVVCVMSFSGALYVGSMSPLVGPSTRMLVPHVCLGLNVALAAAFFPSHDLLSAPFGLQFWTAIVCISALVDAYRRYADVVELREQAPLIGRPATLIRALMIAGLGLVVIATVLALHYRRLTWSWIRLGLICDGVVHLAGALLPPALGLPQPETTPRDEWIARGVAMLLIAAISCGRSREKLSALCPGINRVRFSLTDNHHRQRHA